MKFFKSIAVSLVVISVFVSACTSAEKESNKITSITVNGDQFVDNFGRQVILNGINIVSKNKEEGYIFKSKPELYAKLNSWGVNAVRFIIIWDRLEPEPGVYDDVYLDEIEERVRWAEAHGVFVILDMHQDLYSVKYSDGAPEWATLDEGKTHTTGAIWSDAYMMSEAVQTSFDNFWANTPAADGVGLQDHYAAMWQHVAKRFEGNKNVIGYDIMNEPFPGSLGIKAIETLLTAYGQLIFKLTGQILTEEELMARWGGEESRMEALDLLAEHENYDFVFSQLSPLIIEFESTQLQSMYQKVANEIRKVDTESVLFLEHSYFGNTGVASGVQRTNLPNGSPDSLVAYAPHGYDLVTDTKAVSSASKNRVSYIYNQIKKKGQELQMPVWLGEWGAFYANSDSAIRVAKDAVGLIEENLFSNAYWSYGNETENLEFYNEILIRSYPIAVNGKLMDYKNDFDAKTFTMSWEESTSINEPTVIYVPRLSKLKSNTSSEYSIEKIANSDAGYIHIPREQGGKRSLSLEFN